ncbi:MAG: rhodanese-like domain-containing protein [Actinobacteria bacterium]|nr:rhodanese-like domain-containing protein [Actinomycetota bacterium]
MAVREVGVQQLHAALAKGATLVDVREQSEFDAGHVPGAVHVALSTVPDRVEELRGVGTAYLICRTGARSMRACEFLVDEGIAATNVVGGMVAWVDQGWPVVSV